MKKLLATAAILAFSGTFVLAQGAGVEPPKASDKRPAATTMQTAPVALKKKKRAAKSTKTGKETGTAPDSAGPAAIRK